MSGSRPSPLNAAFATLLLCSAPLLAHAGTFSGWHLNGDASLLDEDATLRVAPLGAFKAGSAWAPEQVSLLGNFSVAFSFKLHGGSAADGFTITFQNSDDGHEALGQSGGFLGYQGIGKSVAFIYDTFDNDFDTDRVSGPNTSVVSFGDLVNGWGGSTIGQPVSFASGLREQVLFSWIDYDVTLGHFRMYLNDVDVKPGTPVESVASDWKVNIGELVFVGFTAATGSLDDNHDILSFSVTQTPVPLPAAAWLLASGLLGLGCVGRRRRG